MMKYRVYIAQINQTYVDVDAGDEEEATDRACRKWRKEEAQPQVLSIETMEPEAKQP